MCLAFFSYFLIFLPIPFGAADSQTYYIDTNAKCGGICDGSESSPFINMYDFLYFIETSDNLPQSLLILLKNEEYLLTEFEVLPYLAKKNVYYWAAFSNFSSKNFHIKAVTYSKFIVKTTKINFLISNASTLTIENLIFLGNDLNIPTNLITDPAFQCYNTTKFCCGFYDFEDVSINKSIYSFASTCKFDTKVTILQPKNPFSFFQFQNYSSFFLLNTSFVNYHMYSFLTIYDSPSIQILSSKFENTSFILYMMSFDKSELIINNSFFTNMIYLSNDNDAKFLIFNENCNITWEYNEWENVTTMKDKQTLFLLQTKNTFLMMYSNFSLNVFLLVQFFYLSDNNSLLISNSNINEKYILPDYISSYYDLVLLNLKPARFILENFNKLIISSSFTQLTHIRGKNYNKIFLRSSLFKYNFDDSLGFIYLQISNMLFIKHCRFEHSEGFTYSGFVTLISYNMMLMYNSSSYQCSCYFTGGCFTFDSFNVALIYNSNFSNNSALSDGGLAFMYHKNFMYFLNCFINSSYTPMQGAAFYTSQNNTIVILNTFFMFSKSDYHGGILYLSYMNKVLIMNCQMYYSFSVEEGGLFYLNSKNTFYLINSTVFNGTSNSEGGVFVASDQNKIVISFSVFMKVFALRKAGFIFSNSQNTFIITFSVFQNSLIGENGLYIYGYKNNMFYLVGNSFQDSILTEKGSLFYFDYDNTIIFIVCSIKNNSDLGEKIIQLNKKNLISFINCLFDESNTNHTYALYAEFNNFIIWNNITTKFQNIDYLIYFVSANNLIISQQKIINFICNKNLISIDYFAVIIIDRVFMKYDIPNTPNMQLFNVNLSAVIIQHSKLHFSHVPFILGKFYNFFLQIIYSEIVRTPLFQSNNFIEGTVGMIFLNKTLSYNNNFVLRNILLVVTDCTFASFKGNNNSVFTITIQEEVALANQIKLFKNYDTVFLNSSFIQNEAKLQGGAIRYEIIYSLTNRSYNFILQSCIFKRNRAHFGAAIYMINPLTVVISQSKFLSNSANFTHQIGKGGFLYVKDLKNISNLYGIVGNYFYNNKANIGNLIFIEGSVYFNDYFFINNNIIYTSIPTQQLYGKIVASTVKTMSFEENIQNSRSLLIPNIVSGQIYDTCLMKIFQYDYFMNFAYENDEDIILSLQDDLSSEKAANFTSIQKLIKNQNLIQKHGYLCLTNAFTASSISEMNKIFNFAFFYQEKLKDSQTKDKTFFLTYKLSSCSFGQRLTDSLTCEDCPRFFYSFNKEFTKTTTCLPCLPNYPFKCFGGANLTLKSDYWRSSKQSTNFFKCPNSDSCYGDERAFDENTVYLDYYSTGVCEVGYTGPLCSVCDHEYGTLGNYVCVKCNEESYYLRLFFFVFLNFIFVFYSIHKNLVMCISLYHKSVDIRVIMSNYLLKIFLNHTEVIMIILNLPLEWPSFTSEIKGVFGVFLQSVNGSSSWECFLKSIGIYINAGYFGLIYVFFMLILILVFSYFYLLFFLKVYAKPGMMSSMINLKPRTSFMKEFSGFAGITIFSTLKTIFLMILSINYSSFVKQILEMTNCQNINDENEKEDLRLIVDYSIEYKSNLHKIVVEYISVPSLLIFCGLPFFVFFVLYKKNKRNLLKNKWTCFYYGYFFYAYEEKYYYWDFIIFMRRFLLITLGVYFMIFSIKYDSVVPLTSILLVLLVSYILQIKIKPFNKMNLSLINKVEKSSLLALTLTLYMATIYNMKKGQYDLYRYSYSTVLDGFIPEMVKQILLGLIFFYNALFYIFWFRSFVSTIEWKSIKSWLIKISTLRCQFCLRRFFRKMKKLKKLTNIIFVNLAINEDFQFMSPVDKISKLDSYNSPTLQTFLLKSKTRKLEKYKKKTENFKDLLTIKQLQVNQLRKTIRNLKKERFPYNKTIENHEKKEIYEANFTTFDNVNNENFETFSNGNIPIICNLFTLNNNKKEILIQTNDDFNIYLKRPKNYFSKIKEYFTLNFILENKKLDKITVKISLEESKYFILNTPKKLLEIEKNQPTTQIKISCYFLKKAIVFPNISFTQIFEQRSTESVFELAIPFNIFFSFYDFKHFSTERNFLTWEEFRMTEKLIIISEHSVNLKVYIDIVKKIFLIDCREKIPYMILFKKKSQTRILQQTWFVLENKLKLSSDQPHILLWGSEEAPDVFNKGVMKWISLLLRAAPEETN